MNTSEFCKDDQRREAVRQKNGLNGLDYLEVSHDQLTLTVFFLGKAPQRIDTSNVRVDGGRRIRNIKVVRVEVHRDPNPELDDWMTVRVNQYGDFSTYTLRVVEAENGKPGNTPRQDFDPRYAQLDFIFKVDCPSDLDCAPVDTCPPLKLDEPEINYLVKDYASFRQLILDRLALIMPDWKERHVPDLGITLVELLAYVGDYLSYYQDAVATEAYLDTARQRISVRRHARLVDYHMHEGCNARAWVCIETDTDLIRDPKEIFFITGYASVMPTAGAVLSLDNLRQIPAEQYEVFEPMTTQSIQLYAAHTEIHFYTWGQRECCLPRGATSVTLRDWYVEAPIPVEASEPSGPPPAQHASVKPRTTTIPSSEPERQLHLQAGDVLIFEEVIGPRTGNPADADPAHRHAVRLTKVTQGEDTLPDSPVPILEVEWASEDALPLPLCISAITDAAHGCHYIEDISIARGNVMLVDHGWTQPEEDLGVVPCASSKQECDCAEHLTDITYLPGRFQPKISKTSLTFSQPLLLEEPSTHYMCSAKQLMRQDVRGATPQIILNSIPAAPAVDCEHMQPLFRPADVLDPTSLISILRDTSNPIAQALRARLSEKTLQLLNKLGTKDEASTTLNQVRDALKPELEQMLSAWSAKYDLLNSGPDDKDFVAEIDNDGYAHLRFGNGELGSMPEAGSSFFATYRVGNGSAGKIGAEAISHLVFRKETLSGSYLWVRNPLPAQGGAEPEPTAEVKLFAPFAFRKDLQRAITSDDYAQLVGRDFRDQVQRGAARLNWTGSWYETHVAVDPFGSEEDNLQLFDAIRNGLYRYRRIGHELSVSLAQYVPLDIEITVCVLPHYLRGHVEAELRDIFSNRLLPDGRLGFFHPDNLTFGEGIYLSKLVAAAQAVTGVESVKVAKLQRLDEGDHGELDDGGLRLGPLEVARLDNDPSFPEHGKLVLDVRGER
jgi:hypothetical protein